MKEYALNVRGVSFYLLVNRNRKVLSTEYIKALFIIFAGIISAACLSGPLQKGPKK